MAQHPRRTSSHNVGIHEATLSGRPLRDQYFNKINVIHPNCDHGKHSGTLASQRAPAQRLRSGDELPLRSVGFRWRDENSTAGVQRSRQRFGLPMASPPYLPALQPGPTAPTPGMVFHRGRINCHRRSRPVARYREDSAGHHRQVKDQTADDGGRQQGGLSGFSEGIEICAIIT